MGIESVIFDLDGTLLDTTEGVIESAKFAARVLGYADLSYETMLKFVGPPIQNSFVQFYNCSKEKAQEAAELFRTYYKTTALIKAVPYKGIFELCETLQRKGKKMAVATYKREDYAVTLLKHFEFDRYCHSMHGADNNNVLKKADIIDLCISELGGSRSEFVLVGDTEHDAIGAQNADINFIGVTYGFGFKSEDDVNVYPNIGVARTPLEVLKIINGGQ